MRRILLPIQFLLILAISTPAEAINRYSDDGDFFRRTALSGSIGFGVPVGGFGSDNRGNHESGGLNWSLDIEHYVVPQASIGLAVQFATFDDKDFGDALQTQLNNIAVFFRYVFESPGPVHPFIRFGVGGMEVSFESDEGTDSADRAASIFVDGGAMFMLNDNIAIDGLVSYNYGFADDAVVFEDFDEVIVVGFDVEYFAFGVGVSVLFP